MPNFYTKDFYTYSTATSNGPSGTSASTYTWVASDFDLDYKPEKSNKKKEENDMSKEPREIQLACALAKSGLGTHNLSLVLPENAGINRHLESTMYENNLSPYFSLIINEEYSELPGFGTQHLVFIVNALDNIDNFMVRANIVHVALTILRKNERHVIAITSDKLTNEELKNILLFAGAKEISDRKLESLEKLECAYIIGY